MDHSQQATASEPETYEIFVYGTLKRGMHANCHLDGCPFLGTATTVEKYLLTSDSYPFLSKAKKVCQVKGECFRITKNVLERLDRYEGVPDFYNRETIKIVIDKTNEVKEVHTYFCEREVGTKVHEDGVYSA